MSFCMLCAISPHTNLQIVMMYYRWFSNTKATGIHEDARMSDSLLETTGDAVSTICRFVCGLMAQRMQNNIVVAYTLLVTNELALSSS